MAKHFISPLSARELALVWKTICVLCMCITSSRALPHDQQGTLADEIGDDLAKGCYHRFPELRDENNSGDDLNLDFSHDQAVEDILKSMPIYEGDFSGERGTLNATGTPENRVALDVRSVNRTAYKDVYLVNVSLSLTNIVRRVNHQSENVSQLQKHNLFELQCQKFEKVVMRSDFLGLFSIRTGLFCATNCPGRRFDFEEIQSRINIGHFQSGVQFVEFWPCTEDTASSPAEFILKSAHRHLNSENVTNTFVQRDCDTLFELQYPRSPKTIANRVVSGVISTLRSSDDASFFHPIHIYGMSAAEYKYTIPNSVFDKVTSWVDIAPQNDLEVWYQNPPFCKEGFYSGMMTVVFNSTCDPSEGNGTLCSPFKHYDSRKDSSYPSAATMTMKNIRCTRGPNSRIRADFHFRDHQDWRTGTYSYHTFPDVTPLTEFLLVAEGYWNNYMTGQLVMVGYHLASNGTPVDTKIQITLQFPTVRTIHHRYAVVGHVRSMRDANDALYFKTFSILGEAIYGISELHDQLTYRYDPGVKRRLGPLCLDFNKDVHKNAGFPDGSWTKLGLDFWLTAEVEVHRPNLENSSVAYSVAVFPLSIHDRFRDRFRAWSDRDRHEAWLSRRYRNVNTTEIPMSFIVTLSPSNTWPQYPVVRLEKEIKIAAEGWYNAETGHLCMLGCRESPDSVANSYHVEPGHDGGGNLTASEHCDVVFSIQYPPTNQRLWSKRSLVTGNITSLLDASHPLYFEPLTLNSTNCKQPDMYFMEQTVWSMLSRNPELILSLLSLSFTTLFVVVQVAHSMKRSSFKNIKYVSFVMLMILISVHLFSLLLSFKATWSRSIPKEGKHVGPWYEYQSPNSEDTTIKWLEAYEGVIRSISMVALLFELRLLQLVWKSRSHARLTTLNESPISPNDIDVHVVSPHITDVVVLQACLPLYAAVMTVVAIVHWHVTHRQNFQRLRNYDHDPILANRYQLMFWPTIWADIQAFAGVVVDLFLLPQVVANALWDTPRKTTPLIPVFYIGITVLRSANHLFEAGRQTMNTIYGNHLDLASLQVLYPNPYWDLYSTSWDILIPCGSILLATLLFLQQKYGGRCFILKRFKSNVIYEQIPNIDL